MSQIDAKSVLILGGPNTGKSHYAFQLFGRLRLGGCAAELRHGPETISLFEQGLERLNQGLAATHTSTNTYLECVLPLLVNGNQIDICWPDYDGEQLYKQIAQRQITQTWQNRLRSTNAWILFVRLGIARRYKDIVSDPLKMEILSASDSSPGVQIPADVDKLSAQAKVIELLQIFLQMGRIDISLPTQNPVLGVVLSCWDELEAPDMITPRDLLSEHAPLISQFIQSNWAPKSYFIVGLSSTEKPLSKEKPDNDFIEKGPESFGFSIAPDGSKTHDLTLPISMLLELAIVNGS